MTIREAINKATIKLKIEKVENPKLKARLLMQFILNQTRQYLIVYDEKKLTKKQEENYLEAVEKLAKGIPLQHITHRQEFMKMDFYVNEHVLIPRPDTEILVEEVIKISKKIRAKKILDLCTGSGAIAVSLAKYIKDSEITATDISEEALEVAERNAKKQQVDNRIAFIQSNLFKEIPKEKYDIIVSNPPYIRKEIIKTLEKEVQNEPYIALNGRTRRVRFLSKNHKSSL